MAKSAVKWLFYELWNTEKDEVEWQKKLKKALLMENKQPKKTVKKDVEDIKLSESFERFYQMSHGKKINKDDHIENETTTEITEEEIEKAKNESWIEFKWHGDSLYSTTYTVGWKSGIEWYKKQLELKKNKK